MSEEEGGSLRGRRGDNLECPHPPRRERDLGEPAPGPPPRTGKSHLDNVRSTGLGTRAARLAEHSGAHAGTRTVLCSSRRRRGRPTAIRWAGTAFPGRGQRATTHDTGCPRGCLLAFVVVVVGRRRRRRSVPLVTLDDPPPVWALAVAHARPCTGLI